MSFKKTLCSLVAGAMLTLNTTPLFSQNYNFKPVKQEAKQESSPWPWVLVGADLALAGYSTWCFYSANKALEGYNKLYSEIDNTNEENLRVLKTQKKIVEFDQALAVTSASLTGFLILYTVVDALWLRNIFPKENVKFNPYPQRLELNIKY